MSARKVHVTVLGSTGSIGDSTLDVLSRNTEQYQIFALTANSNFRKLARQCELHHPHYAVMNKPDAAQFLRDALKESGITTRVLSGAEGLAFVASAHEVETVVAGIVGAAGLMPTLAAVEAGKKVLLANKESLVMTGELLLSRVRSGGAILLPVDSEHNALFQCMPQAVQGAGLKGVEKLLLTASGGPFRGWSKEALDSVSPEQAVAHPNWQMGRKISVDSATLMNKGLEVIEACYLFGVGVERVEVVVHPESVIHSMVSYRDGSVLAQMGLPDMRTPIAHALAWPERIYSGVKPLDLFHVSQLNFEKPDSVSFPCLELAFDSIKCGGTATAVLNAANEIAVEQFLAGNIGFNQIAETIAYALEHTSIGKADSLAAVLDADESSRLCAKSYIEKTGRNKI